MTCQQVSLMYDEMTLCIPGNAKACLPEGSWVGHKQLTQGVVKELHICLDHLALNAVDRGLQVEGAG